MTLLYKFYFFILIILLGQNALAQSKTIEDIMDDISFGVGRLEGELTGQRQKLSASIFDSITDFDLYKHKFGPEDKQGKISIGVEREVYNNYDIADTWTVVDFFTVPLTVPLYVSKGYPIGNGTAKLKLQSSITMETFNIRQVYPRDFKGIKDNSLTSFEDLEKHENKRKDIREAFTKVLEDPDLKGLLFGAREAYKVIKDEANQLTAKDQAKFSLWDKNNQELNARYSNFWNLLKGPFKIPLGENAYRRLSKSEVISYSVNGAIELGLSAGFDLSYGTANTGTTGFGGSVYLLGKYRISILKENNRFAKLKVTRKKEKGRKLFIGSESDDHVLFKGFVIAGKEVLDLTESVIPFEISNGKLKTETFDISYRYDLSKKEAKKAFFKAVRGQLKKSSDLSTIEDSGVEFIVSSDETGHSTFNKKKIEVMFFFEQGNLATNTITKAKFKLPDGTYKMYSAVNYTEDGYDTLWGHSENKQYKIETTLDPSQFKIKKQGLALRFDALLDDSETNSKEYYRYILEVEEFTGQKELFPRVPIYRPISKEDTQNCKMNFHRGSAAGRNCKHKKIPLANYGDSRFKYTLGFTREQIEEFINYPKDKMWNAIENSFDIEKGDWSTNSSRFFYYLRNSYATVLNIPLKLVHYNIDQGNNLIFAERFIKKWKKIDRYTSPDELIMHLGRLFKSKYYTKEIIKILKYTISGQEFAYKISAKNNKIFGVINKRAKEVSIIDNITDKIKKLRDFDRVGAQNVVDNKAIVDNFKVHIKDVDTVNLEFDLSEEPKFLYFRVDRTATFRPFKRLLNLIIQNNSQLVKGKNIITIKRKSNSQKYINKIAQHIFSGEYNTISFSVSNNGLTWGPVESHRFRIEPVETQK